MKNKLIKAGLPKGFNDQLAFKSNFIKQLIKQIDQVIALYGYQDLVTPTFEFTKSLGKFLPDIDRPGQGVFSIEDDKEWLSLRYDLTAPLARFVAQNFDKVARPFKRKQHGLVYRNEKAGPGRFREFMQYDIDIVGAGFGIAEIEIFEIIAKVFSLDLFADYQFSTHYSDRNIITSIINKIDNIASNNIASNNITNKDKLIIFRAIDKLDRLGIDAVKDLLGKGRKDVSGDFTDGANLQTKDIDKICSFLLLQEDEVNQMSKLANLVGECELGKQALNNIDYLRNSLAKLGLDKNCQFDVSIIRGLDYYTGTVYETILTDKLTKQTLSGSVAGGGRYDNLIRRFINQDIPSVGVSFGISRILSLLDKEKNKPSKTVMIAMMDKNYLTRYEQMAISLRDHNITCFVYAGSSGLKAQMKYADKNNISLVVIEGEEELRNGKVQIKDMELGHKLSMAIKDHKEWKETTAQVTVEFNQLVDEVKQYLL